MAGAHWMATAVTSRERTSRRWLRVLLAATVAAILVAYVVYMSLGMPGMNHGAPSATVVCTC